MLVHKDLEAVPIPCEDRTPGRAGAKPVRPTWEIRVDPSIPRQRAEQWDWSRHSRRTEADHVPREWKVWILILEIDKLHGTVKRMGATLPPCSGNVGLAERGRKRNLWRTAIITLEDPCENLLSVPVVDLFRGEV
jgi:hypothetical protein